MKSKIFFISAMMIFGTTGLFVRNIDLPSGEIALLRGLIGSLLLLLLIAFKKRRISFAAIKQNIGILLFSGAALAANWIFLFEAYKHTTIANATLSYYFAPVFVMIMSPFILKEKLFLKKVIAIGVALTGMFLIMQNGAGSGGAQNHLLGIGSGIAAAACYATLMLANKFIKNMNGIETTLLQLAFSAVLLIPYVLLTEKIKLFEGPAMTFALIAILGVVHTGAGFYLFFTGMKGLKGQSIAALSYIDPLTSLLASFVILSESMSLLQIAGAVLLFGATFLSEYKKSIQQKVI